MKKGNKKTTSEKKEPSPGRRRIVNPFAFLLAKRFVDYGFVGMGDEPSDLQFAKNIYNRYKGPGFKNTSFNSEKSDFSANSRAETLYKILKLKNSFSFTQNKLDILVREIKYPFYNFQSWNDFIKHLANHPAYIAAMLMLRKKKSFTQNEINQFTAQTNFELYRHHTYLTLADKQNNPFFFHFNKRFATRNANAKEIDIIEMFEDHFGIIPNRVFTFLKTYRLFNSTAFYTHIDEFQNILVYLLLIPLKEKVYKKIKARSHFINILSPTEIMDTTSNNSINYFYFHLGNYPMVYSLDEKILKCGLRALFSKLHTELGDLTFGITTDNMKDIRIIENIGFRRIEEEKIDSNFFELHWTEKDCIVQAYEFVFNEDPVDLLLCKNNPLK